MEFYIQNTERGYLGNAMIFWGKNGNGYTSDLNNCGKYSEEDAHKNLSRKS